MTAVARSNRKGSKDAPQNAGRKGRRVKRGNVGTQPHVLLVDDNPDTMDLLREQLTASGYKVSTADGAQAALAAARQSVPDVVLADALMPGMSGAELIAEFRRLYPTVGRIALTGTTRQEVLVSLLRSGTHDLIMKPPSLAEVLERIELTLAVVHSARRPPKTVKKTQVFIGSSLEGLPFAKAMQQELDSVAEVTIWSQGVFGLMGSTLDSIYTQLDSQDFAVLLMTADDLLISRGQRQPAARDNVLLELGMFLGRLGRERTFAVFDRAIRMHVPSDLAGVTLGSFEPHSTGNRRASIGPVCTLIEERITRMGARQ